jgi:hypothetical protein
MTSFFGSLAFSNASIARCAGVKWSSRAGIDGRRFVPAFQVADDVGETFGAMVEELAGYRLARYLFTKSSPLEAAFRLKVIQARGRPILMLNRDHNPQLPEGETPFTADGVVYTGNFAKIALNVAHRAGPGAGGCGVDPGLS